MVTNVHFLLIYSRRRHAMVFTSERDSKMKPRLSLQRNSRANDESIRRQFRARLNSTYLIDQDTPRSRRNSVIKSVLSTKPENSCQPSSDGTLWIQSTRFGLVKTYSFCRENRGIFTKNRACSWDGTL
ncbi:hypothetical protein ABKN59_011216 [Abortiporus biennis]